MSPQAMKQKASLVAPPSHLGPLIAQHPVVHEEDITEEQVIPESPSPESMDVVQVAYRISFYFCRFIKIYFRRLNIFHSFNFVVAY